MRTHRPRLGAATALAVVALTIGAASGVELVRATGDAATPDAPADGPIQPELADPRDAPFELRGETAVRVLGALRLTDDVAAFGAMSELELVDELRSDDSMFVGAGGELGYVEPVPAAAVLGDAPPDEQTTPAVAPADVDPLALHSRPSSTRTIYLDVDGHTTADDYWNSSFSIDTIVSAPYDVDGDTSSFSSTELDRIEQIWRMVADDYAPFDVDVTTEDPGVDGLRRTSPDDAAYGIRVVISPSDWYSTATGQSSGGIAYLHAFEWDRDSPAFVFTSNLSNGRPKYVADAASHEAGHTFGLRHDGTSSAQYYSGHGDWGPIMGSSYVHAVSQWSRGEYPDADNTEDDLALIAGYLDLVVDDHGDDPATATVLAPSATVDGLLGVGDADVFRVEVGAGPLAIGLDPRDLNVHASVQVLDAVGGVVLTLSPDRAVGWSSSGTITADAGTVYVMVAPTGWLTPSTGFTAYGSLGAYSLEIDATDPPPPTTTSTTSTSPSTTSTSPSTTSTSPTTTSTSPSTTSTSSTTTSGAPSTTIAVGTTTTTGPVASTSTTQPDPGTTLPVGSTTTQPTDPTTTEPDHTPTSSTTGTEPDPTPTTAGSTTSTSTTGPETSTTQPAGPTTTRPNPGTTTHPTTATPTTWPPSTEPPRAHGDGASLRPIDPVRLVDTRTGLGGSLRLVAGQRLAVQVTGRHDVPRSATSAVVNVTAVRPASAGYLSIGPCTAEPPETSTVNYATGQVLANTTIARLDEHGRFCVWTHGSTDVLVDLTGWLGPDGGSRLTPVEPRRVADTRRGLGGSGRLRAGGVLRLDLGDTVGDTATAVALNVTAVAPAAAGNLAVYPCGGERPGTSTVNHRAAETRPNNTIVGLADGRVCVASHAESDVLVDLVGVFTPSPAGLTYEVADPARLLDTRAVGAPIRAAGSVRYDLTSPDAGDVLAATVNLTAVGHRLDGYTSTSGCDEVPATSTLNQVVGQVAANGTIAPAAEDGSSCAWMLNGGHLIVDLAGWWT